MRKQHGGKPRREGTMRNLPIIRGLIGLIFLTLIACITLGAQESGAQAEQPKETEGRKAEPKKPGREGLEPLFEQENPNIVFIEGEDAVSTNFNKQPILNYSCSGSRTLQLNRSLEVQWGSAFYADFVFFVEEGGTYELWYGGSPPGPSDELLPSYASPFQYSFDGQELKAVYREDVNVVQVYAPSYYWSRIDDVQLGAGQHTVSFQVSEKRRYDGRFYFYLDCFFLVKKTEGKRVVGEPVPRVFPNNMESRIIDYPFRALEDYEIGIRDDPKNTTSYLELSLIYALLGDHLNAIKYVKRASLLEPDNTVLLMLRAKNHIYRGDVTIGLKLYWELLEKDPNKLDVWMEAGKIAAWTGRYDESVKFFSRGLETFPDSIDLLANLGLTYLWASKEDKADEIFARAKKTAGQDYRALQDLAHAFKVNGYPDRANEVYRQLIKLFPQNLQSYVQLEEIYYRNDQQEKADEVSKQIERAFRPSEKLTRFLEVFHTKQRLKEQVIDEYKKQLEDDPDNLELRQILAQTYFWNGLRSRAIEEYLNILATYAFRSLTEMDGEASELFNLLNRGYAYLSYFNGFPQFVNERKKELSSELGRYRSPDKRDERKMMSLVDKTRFALERYSGFETAYSGEIGELETMKAWEMEEEEAFRKIVEATQWEWNRDLIVSELKDTAERGLSLANYVLSKIYLVERNLQVSESLLEDLTQSEPVLPQYQYAFIQNLIWNQKPTDAVSRLAEVKGEVETDFPDVISLEELLGKMQADFEDRGIVPGDLVVEAATLQGELDRLSRESTKQVSRIRKDLETLHNLLERRFVRKAYFLQENTYLIRRELGEYYIEEGNLDAAIQQLQLVLAIDPWDVEAVYGLGRVFERNGDWSAAMASYKKVFYADPSYENAAQLYNNLARQYADTLNISATSMFDTSYITLHGEASFVHRLSGTLGWSLSYENDTVRIYNPTFGGEVPSTYQIHTLAFGVPVELHYLNLRLHPQLGVSVWNVLFEDDEAQGVSEGSPPGDFFGYMRVFPTFAVDATFGLGDFVLLSGGYSFGINKDTVADGRHNLVNHIGELGVTVNFGFVDAWPLRDSSSRTYGKAQYISDGNLIYEVLQEFQIGLLKSQTPEALVALLITGVFQDSLQEEDQNYWAPQEILSVDGGLLGSVYFPVGEEKTLGLSLRVSGGIYMERLFEGAENRFRLSSAGNFELNYGDATYYLGVDFSSNTRSTEQAGTGGSFFDYWSLFVTLGYASRLPRLLAP